MIIDYICDIFEEVILPNKIKTKDIKEYSLEIIKLFYKSNTSNLSQKDEEFIHYYLANIAYDDNIIPLILSFFKKKIPNELYYQFILWLSSFSLFDSNQRGLLFKTIFLLINSPVINIENLEEDLQKSLEDEHLDIQISLNKMYSSSKDFLNPFTLYKFKEDMYNNNFLSSCELKENHEPYIIVMNISYTSPEKVQISEIIDDLFNNDDIIQHVHLIKDIPEKLMEIRILNLLKNYEYSDFSHLTMSITDQNYIYLLIYINQTKCLQLAFNKDIYQAIIDKDPNYILDMTHKLKESLLKVNPTL